MGPVLLLYGSKARSDSRATSDVDLLLALDGEDLARPTNTRGVSLHRYPKSWLENSARAGTLFSYHVAFEGVVLEDQGDFLGHLRGLFTPKPSYKDELVLGALVIKLLLEKDWEANFSARQRFFWALRTVLIAASTCVGPPKFAADALERLMGIPGAAALIDARETASFESCQRIGFQVLATLPPSCVGDLSGPALREHLMLQGGIARDSVRVVEESEAIADMGLAIYL